MERDPSAQRYAVRFSARTWVVRDETVVRFSSSLPGLEVRRPCSNCEVDLV